MSMTDLFGSDEGSEVESDEENVEGKPELEGEAQSSSDEQYEGEDVSNEGKDEEEEEEEEERQEEDAKEMEEEKSDVEEQEQEDEDEHEHEEGVNEKDSENEGSEQDEAEQSEKEEKLSDQEDEDKPPEKNKNVSSMDLFGEDVSSEEDENEVEKKQESETQDEDVTTDSFQQHLASDEEQEEDQPEETQINVEIPYSKFSLGSEISFVKLPNFLSVETKPFDPATYEDEFEEDEVMDDEGRSRLKLRVENTVRWRNAKDKEGNDVKESNARVVKWSDGTMSLLLGAEVFDIHKTKIDGEHNHLFVQQGTGLQGQAIFREKLTFRPHSTNSQTHRKMTLSIADRVSKAGKIKILPVVGKDPESQKSELIKKEEEKLRAQLRRENQQRRMRERSNARGLTASYLEPDRYEDDEEALEQSLLAMKKHYKKGLAKGRLNDVYSDQESEEEGISGGLESDDDSGENSTDKGTSENDSSRQRKHSFEEPVAKKKRKKVIAESDEDESD